ncbi:MAG: energy transducer TonB [Bacteroidetes bacterium]|nr:energy transducer TonB [Bacteroidota bacterium]
MVARTVSYGAMELKEVAHRYWVAGLLISIAIHSAVLGVFELRWFDGRIDLTDIPLHPPRWPEYVPVEPTIRGIAPMTRTPGKATVAPGERATPTPVPDDRADPNKEMATQEDLAWNVDPASTGTGKGEVRGTPAIPVPADDTPVPFEAVEKLPILVSRPVPIYPEVAIKAGIEGRVVVKVLVGKDGRVREAVVLYSNADCLNDAAVTAAKEYLFVPAIMNNGPVSVWVSVPFSFRLK